MFEELRCVRRAIDIAKGYYDDNLKTIDMALHKHEMAMLDKVFFQDRKKHPCLKKIIIKFQDICSLLGCGALFRFLYGRRKKFEIMKNQYSQVAS